MKNPILEELWQVRARIEAEYGGDLEKYCDDLAKEFQTGKPRVVVVSEAIRKRAERAMKPKYDKLPPNPILDEIYGTRARIMKRFGYDMDKHAEYLEKKYQCLPHVKLEPKKIERAKKSVSRAARKPAKSKSVARKKTSA